MQTAEDVLHFWFIECTVDDWWSGRPDFDERLSERFTETHRRVALGEAFGWRVTARGRLAEIIVLDQFSRQVHRGSPRAFAQDGMALVLAQEAVAGGHHLHLPPVQRGFLLMPFMHSESALVHQSALPLFTELGDENLLEFERLHAQAIERFGRYPKRNAVLGRASTPEELAYLAEIGDRAF